VLPAESEKAALAARQLLHSHIATTRHGGAGAVLLTDWAPLGGCAMVIWPNHNGAGQEAEETALEVLRAGGAASVRLVELPGDWAARWYQADPLPNGAGEDPRGCLHGAALLVGDGEAA